jgi:hypothetical protein
VRGVGASVQSGIAVFWNDDASKGVTPQLGRTWVDDGDYVGKVFTRDCDFDYEPSQPQSYVASKHITTEI